MEGDLLPRLYAGKSGETKLSLEITASDVKFLSERSATNAQDTTNNTREAEDEAEDALPF